MLKKYPFVKQTGIKDCGVACLQMIIKYYQGYIDTIKLQEMTKTTKNGTDAYHLIEAAKQIGFEAKGIKTSLEKLNDVNLLPCIANVTIDNTYNHYIVIYKIDFKNKKILVADPALNLRKISFDDFENIWNNVLLIMYPIKKIPVIGREQSFIRMIYDVLFFNKKILLNIIILSLFFSLFSILSSYYFKFIGDTVIFNTTKSYLIVFFFLFLLLTSLKILSSFFRNKLLVYLNEKFEIILTNNIFKNIISLPYNYYRNHTTGEIVSRVNDLEKIRDLISKLIIIVFVDLPISLISFILLFIISRSLFFISILIFLLYLITNLFFTYLFKSRIKSVQISKADYTSFMVESINGFESIKGNNMELYVKNKFEKKFINYLNNMFDFQNVFNNQNLVHSMICDIGTVVMLFIGSILILDNKLTLGNLLFFYSIFDYFLYPLKNLLEFNVIYNESKNSFKRISEILVKEESKNYINYNKINTIEFKNLSFSYNDRDIVIKNISLKIKNGDKLMIIGKSGSGKSTLMKLLMKYYKVSNNCIFINNIDIVNVSDKKIKEDVVYISQNETLFTDTLYNNIVLDNKVDNDYFIKIANLCKIDEIVKNNNLGYNMLIEENGFNLSGGEKQRIILARSLMRSFDVLIIDEGLNQMDINLERIIIKNILNEYPYKTIIIISHRVDNMDLFERIIKFSNNKIVGDTKNER